MSYIFFAERWRPLAAKQLSRFDQRADAMVLGPQSRRQAFLLDICHRILEMNPSTTQRFMEESFTTSAEGRAKYAQQLRGETSDDETGGGGGSADISGSGNGGTGNSGGGGLNLTANNRDGDESDELLVRMSSVSGRNGSSNSNGGQRLMDNGVPGGMSSHLANPEIPLSELVVKFGERGNNDGVKDPDVGYRRSAPTSSLVRLTRATVMRARKIFMEGRGGPSGGGSNNHSGSAASAGANTTNAATTAAPSAPSSTANAGSNSGNNPLTPA